MEDGLLEEEVDPHQEMLREKIEEMGLQVENRDRQRKWIQQPRWKEI